MRRLLLITGDIAAGKTTFSRILAARCHAPVFQKDTIKEILGDRIGFANREENRRLSSAAMQIMRHIFSSLAAADVPLILEANFHTEELNVLHTLAAEHGYDVLTLVLRGEPEVLYGRYLYRMNEENRHPVHLSTTLHIREDFLRTAAFIRSEHIPGHVIEVCATDCAYQTDAALLQQIDAFMQ
ncbi:MAG: AAA family ATPase [Clostridia bacterium]|nr:AAA family ATPase [Clostridia bacterium]